MTDLEGIEDSVAIIGMSGRFPGAKNIQELWSNLCEGRDCLTEFSKSEISSLVSKEVLESPDYVPVRGILDKSDMFDADFFGMSAREAQMMDPQQRVFLECAWHAFEDAGYVGKDVDGLVSVFGGMGNSTYFLNNLKSNPELIEKFGEFQTMLCNEKDFLATRVAHKLDLKGPCLSINTGCSTSLVAVSEAYNSLLNFHSDMALAGGVSIQFPDQCGYLYVDGGIASKTGKCRTFDVQADGTVFGNGAGIVVMKRLEEAIVDRDRVYAVIRGVGVNNDGSKKLSFTAPSVDGQSAAISMAQTAAEVDADSLSYIEAHGTATPVGDPIEVEALTQAFSATGDKKQFCGIGSIKSNIGHLDTAAGIAGLIKSVLILQHKKIPPTIHYNSPNAAIDFSKTPFYVTDKTVDLSSISPLRVGVSSFGVGGTNAHVILEEAPKIKVESDSRPYHLLLWSGKQEGAARELASSLHQHLQDSSDISLADTSYTLQTGREHFTHRQFFACRNKHDALETLSKPARLKSRILKQQNTDVVFMFPGQGSQYVNMAKTFYQSESVFSENFDICCSTLSKVLSVDIKSIIYPSEQDSDNAEKTLNQTAITQPALFVIEYCLAKLWQSWGVNPSAMIGHSVGEYVAACLAGVFSLEDALKIIAKRGELIQSLPSGSMLAVRQSDKFLVDFIEKELTDTEANKISIAVVNTFDACVAAGDNEIIETLKSKLNAQKIKSLVLKTSHAFHSSMMDPILAEFESFVEKITLNKPTIKFISSATGDWISDEDAVSPAYWANHIRSAVQFAKGRQTIFRDAENQVLLEVGPGNTLANIAKHKGFEASDQLVISSVGNANDKGDEDINLMEALGSLWAAGVNVDWQGFYQTQQRSKVGLPVYPFQRKSHWVEAKLVSLLETPTNSASVVASSVSELNQSSTESCEANHAEGFANREAYLVSELKSLLIDLSGMDDSELFTDVSFIKLGFDSLFLTQVNTAFKKKFKIEISFRQLLESTSTIDDMAIFLDEKLDESEFQPPQESSVKNVQPDELNGQNVDVVALKNGNDFSRKTSLSSEVRKLMEQEMRVGTASDEQRHGPWKQINKTIREDVKESHRKGLDSLISAYTERTKNSKQLIQKHRPHFADPRSISGFNGAWKEIIYPIVTDRSKGSRMWDIDGNEYIDVQSGFGSVLFGQNPDFIRDAIIKQLEFGPQVGPQSKLAGEVAEKVCAITGMDRVTFCNTGSEAVLAAMRVSRTVTGNNKIVIFSGDYHGIFDDVVARPAGGKNKLTSLPAAPGIPKESLSNTIVLEFGDPNCFDVINSIADDIAAILVEPVQSSKPSLQPRAFLKELRSWTIENSVPLIFDEVITGMRIHPRGAQGWYGIDADMVTYGKIIGGGMPAGLLAGSKQYMDTLDGGMWQYGDDSVPEVGVTFFAGTFVRHPLMIAAANAVSDELKRGGEKLYTDLNAKADRLAKSLNTYFDAKGVPLYIQNCGSMMVIEFLAKLEYNPLFFYHLRLSGIFLLDAGSFFLNFSHTEEDTDRLIASFKQAAEFMMKYEFFPSLKAITEFPLTKPQQEIWLATQVSDDANCAYNLSSTIEFEGDLDIERLSRALVKLVNTNDALRLSVSRDGIAKIGDKLNEIKIQIDDLSSQDEDQKRKNITLAADRDVETPFDLENGPLIRFRLFVLSDSSYLLFFTIHHVASDGWSCGVIPYRLAELYNTSTSSDLSAKPIAMQFSEYAQWLQEPDQLRRSKEGHDYWVNLHGDAALDLELPLDKPRPPIKTYSANQISVVMETGFIGEVNEFARQQGVTPFTFMLSAFEVLIYRISAQKQFNIGVPAAGHMQVGDHYLLGHCVNFLPLRCSLDTSKAFSELLTSTQSHVFEAFEHQFFTYGELITSLGLGSEASRNALISLVFNVDKLGAAPEYDGLTVKLGANDRHFEMFEMFLNVVVTDSDMSLECVYNSDLFQQETIERWMTLYEKILRDFIRGEEKPLQDISIISSEEKCKLLDDWNQNQLVIPKDINVLSLIDKQASLLPQKCAATCNGEILTYQELIDRSNQLANYLIKRGVRPGSLLGLCVGRSTDMLVALLAILRCGCAYVPLDPEYPQDRLKYMVKDADLALLLIQSEYKDLFSKTDNFIELDKEKDQIAGESKNPVVLTIDENQTAYIIYTSGSTGKPKGVEIAHRALTNFLVSMAQKPGLNSSDRLLAVTTLSFDIAVLELYLPLTVGGSIVIATVEQAVDGVELIALIKEHDITCMQSTPARWRLLVEAGLEKRQEFKVLCGGEALQLSLSAQLFELSSELWNMYGPTETTVYSTIFKVNEENCKALIGRPIYNTHVYILDESLQPVPVGVPGELYIGGLGVAKGYLNRPELNAERFIENPFDNNAGSKLYRSGDLVRYLEGGDIEYFSRLDTQIKIRGFRIEIGEVESVLTEHVKIAQTAVTLKTFGDDDVRLVAYFRMVGSGSLTSDELREFMGATLPEYMVPSYFIELQEFPLTPSGKVDKKNLPTFNVDENLKEYVAPQSDLEKDLASIWADILGVKKVGMDDNFFDLGGHSLLAVKLSSRIRERYEVNLNLRTLFSNPKLNSQSLLVEGLSPLVEDTQDDGDMEDFVI